MESLIVELDSRLKLIESQLEIVGISVFKNAKKDENEIKFPMESSIRTALSLRTVPRCVIVKNFNIWLKLSRSSSSLGFRETHLSALVWFNQRWESKARHGGASRPCAAAIKRTTSAKNENNEERYLRYRFRFHFSLNQPPSFGRTLQTRTPD